MACYLWLTFTIVLGCWAQYLGLNSYQQRSERLEQLFGHQLNSNGKKTSQLPFSETIRYHFVIRLVIWFVLALNVCGYKDKYCLFAWNPQDNLCVQKKKMSLAKGFIYRHTNEDIRLTGRTLCLAPFRIISVLLSALKWSLSRDSCQDFFPIALKKFDLNMIALSFRLISWSNLCRVWAKWFDKGKDPSTSF